MYLDHILTWFVLYGDNQKVLNCSESANVPRILAPRRPTYHFMVPGTKISTETFTGVYNRREFFHRVGVRG